MASSNNSVPASAPADAPADSDKTKAASLEILKQLPEADINLMEDLFAVIEARTAGRHNQAQLLEVLGGCASFTREERDSLICERRAWGKDVKRKKEMEEAQQLAVKKKEEEEEAVAQAEELVAKKKEEKKRRQMEERELQKREEAEKAERLRLKREDVAKWMKQRAEQMGVRRRPAQAIAAEGMTISSLFFFACVNG